MEIGRIKGEEIEIARLVMLISMGIEPRSLDRQANTLPRRCKK